MRQALLVAYGVGPLLLIAQKLVHQAVGLLHVPLGRLLLVIMTYLLLHHDWHWLVARLAQFFNAMLVPKFLGALPHVWTQLFGQSFVIYGLFRYGCDGMASLHTALHTFLHAL